MIESIVVNQSVFDNRINYIKEKLEESQTLAEEEDYMGSIMVVCNLITELNMLGWKRQQVDHCINQAIAINEGRF